MHERIWHQHYDYTVPISMRYPRIPIHELLNMSAKIQPDKAAYDFFGSTMTFWELRERTVSMANALIRIGVEKGDRVALHLPNCPQYIIAYVGTLMAGGVVTNLNPMYSTDELEHIIGDTSVSTLFTFEKTLDSIRGVLDEIDVKRVIVTQVTDFIDGFPKSTAKSLDLDEGWYHFNQLLESGTPDAVPRVPFSPDDPAMIQFTGGTTGVPKGAVLTQANLVAATLLVTQWGSAIVERMPSENKTCLAILPFFHVYGSIVALNCSLYGTRTQILIPRFEIDEVLDIMSRFEEITLFPAVPTLINAIINAPGASALNLRRRLGLLNNGGGPMPQELIEQVESMGIVYSEGWGMSETTSAGCANPLLGACKPGSIGIPLPDADIRIVDVDDPEREVEPGESGELVFKGPTVMKEYWNNPEETEGQLKDGWLSTGDVVQMDEDGYLYIVDRKKDMIIAGGYNVYPREIDEVLYRNSKIAEAVAVGVPDEYRGETIKAVVVLKPGQEATSEEIIEFCRGKLAPYKAPKSVVFRESLPKSNVGKILRRAVRDEELAKMEKKE